MDSKRILFDLIEKCRTKITKNREYIICNSLLEKIGATILKNEAEESELDLTDILNLTDEELSMFALPDSIRIISSLKMLVNKKGWRADTVLKLVKKLKEDLINNKMKEFDKEKDSLDEFYKIIDEDLFLENSDLILEFIKLGVENKMLSMSDAIKLNFYVLSKCNVNSSIDDKDDIEVVALSENIETSEIVRKKIASIFGRYGYEYDANKMGEFDEKLVKYADLEYLAYILSKFKEYNVDSKTLYSRKIAFCNIVLDNDRGVFNSILNFIDTNNCTLSTLLSIPSIFFKRKKSYVVNGKVNKPSRNSDEDSVVLEISGAYQDFFENIVLYKQLSGDIVFDDEDFMRLGKFLCTPNSLIRKNIKILEKYGIISSGEFPKAIVSMCGENTEYIIDRIIEAGLFEQFLLDRVNNSGELKPARGTYYLDGDSNPFRFYKMRRANDIGDPILTSTGGIKKVFIDNNTAYNGIRMVPTDEGFDIVQDQLPISFIESIDPGVRKILPSFIQSKIGDGYDENIIFELLYKYNVYNAVDAFAYSDARMLTTLKGDQIQKALNKDYKRTITLEDIKSVNSDKYIKMLDSAVYCDMDGNSVPLKKNDLVYEFFYTDGSDNKLVISRLKVLRLCRLLKEEHCWLTKKSSDFEIENTILAILQKDSILSEMDTMILRATIRAILANGIIMMPGIISRDDKRGARQ